MPACAVASCQNYSIKTKSKNTEVKYFRFPKNVNLWNQWKYLCGRTDKINFSNARICSIHFEESSFDIPLKNKLLDYYPKTSRFLKSDALPTLCLPGSSQKTKCMSDSQARQLKKEHDCLIAEVLEQSEMESQPTTIQRIREIPEKPKDLTIYCRLCLNPVDKNQMIRLGNVHDINYPKNKILLSENYLKMIKIVLPNFDHTIVNDPVMCNDCVTHLEVAFDFVEQCMDTQTRIQRYKNEKCPWNKTVNCEEVVRNKTNKTQLPLTTSNATVPPNPKKRKIEEMLSSANLVEQSCQPRTIPPEEVETIIIKMEEEESGETEQENYGIIEEEICDIKEDFDEEEPQIQTNDEAIKTQSERSLPANNVVKSGSGSTETQTPGFLATDVSCNVKSTLNTSELYSTVPCLNSSNLNLVVPMGGYILVNPTTFSSLKSKFQNS